MKKITYDFKNRTAIVTGGAQGFGLDIAKRFLDSGGKVIIWDIDTKMIEQVIKELDNPNSNTLGPYLKIIRNGITNYLNKNMIIE